MRPRIPLERLRGSRYSIGALDVALAIALLICFVAIALASMWGET